MTTVTRILKYVLFSTMAIFVVSSVWVTPAHAQLTNACSNYFNSSVAIPAGYGAAYNVFSSSKETLVFGDCNQIPPVFHAGIGLANQYVYKMGYVYKGGAWQPVNLTGAGALVSNSWYVGAASTALPLTKADLSNWNYLVAYVCSWNGTAWKCGCADTACTVNNWQLQSIQIPGSGGFHVAGGKIIDPNGAVWTGKGINLYDNQMGSFAQVMSTFPKLKIFRIPVYDYNQTAAVFADFIAKATAQHIVVLLEDHNNNAGGAGGSQGVVFTGAILDQELAWYKNVAAAYANNPYVWFGTNNEPSEVPSAAALSTWQKQTYDAIRSTGNNNMVLVEMNCWADVNSCGQGYTASEYTGMRNIVWDMHYYGWLSGMSTDIPTITANYNGHISSTQQWLSADGTVPVFVGEYGPSTDGQNRDPDGPQVVDVVAGSNYPSAAWHWESGAADDNLTSGGSLTPYGQQVAGFISAQ